MNVVVLAENTLYDDNGTPLFSGEEYDVAASDLINSYISSGLLSAVEDSAPVAEEAPAETPKKTVSNKTPRAQETVADNTEENSNG